MSSSRIGARMLVHILYSDSSHPALVGLDEVLAEHDVEWNVFGSQDELTGGDILFLIGCQEIVRQDVRELYDFSVLTHTSDLPRDRGWSPVNWLVLENSRLLTNCLINVSDPVDSGDVWVRESLELDGTETWQEISRIVTDSDQRLLVWSLTGLHSHHPEKQIGKPTYRRRRVPEDSNLDPYCSIAEQFDLLRASDPDRYPAHFEFRGRMYRLSLEPLLNE